MCINDYEQSYMSVSYEDHVKLLEERREYHIEKSQGDVDYARTKGEDLSSHTGDVIKEFWCGVLFREHKYLLKEEYDTSVMGMQNSYDGMSSKRTLRYFTTTDVPTTGLEIPASIRSGRWTDPSKNSIWESFQEARRIGPEWGIYTENYVDTYTVEQLKELEDKALWRVS